MSFRAMSLRAALVLALGVAGGTVAGVGPMGGGVAAAQPAAAPETAQAEAVACAPDRVAIRVGPDRALTFRIELADTAESRARGLMYRRSVPQGTGMLFVYPTPQPVSFWMRNTLIPLDLVFADRTGMIRHIHHDARPLDETPIPGAAIGDPNPDRLVVLEIAGGEAARLGLHAGQPLAHPVLDPRTAAWPCR